MTDFPPRARLSLPLLRGVWFSREVPFLLARTAARYGDLVEVRPGLWLASHPDFTRQILVENAGKWSKSTGTEKMGRFLGDGLLNSHGAKHRARRRVLQPLFSQARLRFAAQTIVESAIETRQRWQDGQVVDMHHEMADLALQIVARAVFGTVLSEQKRQISAALDEAMRLFNGAMTPLGDLYERLPPVQKRFTRARSTLDGIVFDLLEKRKTEGANGEDALSVLLRASDENGAPLGDEDIRDEALTLLLAGHETTANALSFAWWLLGHNSQAREKLDAEVQSVLGNRAATWDDLENLRWTRAILSETMRLFPPAWIVGRRALEPIELESGGRRFCVPAGTSVLTSALVLGRDKRFWERPKQFWPARWENDFTPVKWSYFPFGGGHRACLAENFAWVEAILGLATLAQEWKAAPIGPLQLEPSVTLRPRGALPMRLRLRGETK